jgi:hypothetical protein
MENTGTAVAVRPPSDEEIEGIRAKGRALAIHKKEVNELFRTLEGMEWGGGNQVVKGSSFSPQTRYMLAQFCQITRANPMTQVDILGGKPYLNVHYWKDRVSNDPMFVDDWQRDISRSAEDALRALGAEDEANDIARARAKYHPPEWATHVVETGIRRWMNAAPMDAIRAGRIPFEEAQKWIVDVRDFNFAGGRPLSKKRDGGTYQSDPVGEAEPAKTAASRSYRRTSEKAFSSWMTPFAEQIAKAEQAIEAEWEIVQEQPAPHTPHTVSTGNGEPGAGSGPAARPLPVRGEPAQDPQVIEGEVVEDEGPEPTPEPFDKKKAHGALFATLTALGIADEERKVWAKANGLPASTKGWGAAEYDRAMHVLMDPLTEEVASLATQHNVDLVDLALEQLGKDHAEYAKDWIRLRDVLRRHRTAAEPAADEEEDL